MKKQTIITIALAVLLVIAGGYIGIGKYNSYKQEKDLEVFQQGAQYGYEQAVVQIAGMAVSCEQVPLNVGPQGDDPEGPNQIINMIAVDCLQAQAQG